VPEVLSSKHGGAPDAFELTAKSYIDCKHPVVSLNIRPLKITNSNQTASDLNEGLDRFNSFFEVPTAVERP
jgi:hypothetical protein